MDKVYINVPKLLARKVASCVSEYAKIKENLEICTALSKMNLTNGSLHGMMYTQVENIAAAYPKLRIVKLSRSQRVHAKVLEESGIKVQAQGPSILQPW